MSTETNTTATRTLTFREGAEVSAWVTGPEHFTEMLVGVWTPTESWAAKADMSGSVRFDGVDRETWANLIRLAHLHVDAEEVPGCGLCESGEPMVHNHGNGED